MTLKLKFWGGADICKYGQMTNHGCLNHELAFRGAGRPILLLVARLAKPTGCNLIYCTDGTYINNYKTCSDVLENGDK